MEPYYSQLPGPSSSAYWSSSATRLVALGWPHTDHPPAMHCAATSSSPSASAFTAQCRSTGNITAPWQQASNPGIITMQHRLVAHGSRQPQTLFHATVCSICMHYPMHDCIIVANFKMPCSAIYTHWSIAVATCALISCTCAYPALISCTVAVHFTYPGVGLVHHLPSCWCNTHSLPPASDLSHAQAAPPR
jgi:hypothetical protein